MHNLRYIGAVMAVMLIALMAGCAVMPSDDVRENLAAAEITYASVVDTAVSLRDQGYIDPGTNTEEQITASLVGANSALQAAHELVKAGDLDAAQGRVDQARSILRIVQSVLQEVSRE